MNALQKRLADYQNGGTFPDYAELMVLAEGLHDTDGVIPLTVDQYIKQCNERLEEGKQLAEQPVKYVDVDVDVEKIKSLCRKAFSFGQTYWYQADSEYASNHRKSDITLGKFNDLLNEIQELLAPHELRRLSDEEVEILQDIYLSEEYCTIPVLIRKVESKVRGEE